MRLLLTHSKPFSYKCESPAKFAEEPGEGAPAQAKVDDALVAMFAIEKQDGLTPDRAVGRAAIEIEKAFKSSGAKKLVLFPYALLSNNLPSPDIELAVIKKLREAIAHLPHVNCPFGWQRSFSLNAAGKGDAGRVIEFEQSEITRSVDRGREHAAVKAAENMRQALLDMSFDEVVNPVVMDEGYARGVYGAGAAVEAEHAWRLAPPARPDMPLDEARKNKVLEIAPGFGDFSALGRAMKRYSNGEIGAGELVGETASLMKFPAERAEELVPALFPEIETAGAARAGHILAHEAGPAWLPALGRAAVRMPPPVKLFATGPRYRIEPQSQPYSAPESISVSLAVMARDMSLDAGKKIVADLLRRLGLDKLSYRRRKTTRRYFETDSDTGIYVEHGDEYIKVGSMGFFSHETLDAHGVSGLKVFCADFGVERLAVILGGGDNIASLEWPPAAGALAMDDGEMAATIGAKLEPQAPELRGLALKLAAAALEKKDMLGPAEHVLHDGPFAGRNAVITVFNWDEGRPLLSLAAGNTLYVRQGSIHGLPRDGAALGDKYASVYEQGVNTGITFMDIIMLGFIAEAEDRAGNPRPGTVERRWKIAKSPEDINLGIPAETLAYIRRNRKTVKAGGPLFFGLRADIK